MNFRLHARATAKCSRKSRKLHGATARQVALAFLTRLEGAFAIPKAESEAHVRENAAAGDLRLTPEDIKAIDAAFPVREAAGLPTL